MKSHKILTAVTQLASNATQMDTIRTAILHNADSSHQLESAAQELEQSQIPRLKI